MDVTFTRLAGRLYAMMVRRERGPVLAPRQGPGYDEVRPHDLAHFVERELGPRARQRRREARRGVTTA